MVNLYLNVYEAHAFLSQSASCLRMIERAGVAGRFGFVERGLRDDFRWAASIFAAREI